MAANSTKINQLLIPGDEALQCPTTGTILLGNGLFQPPESNAVIATKCGILRKHGKRKHWIEGSQKRFIPQVDDQVIGIIHDRIGENFTVDIGAANRATLPVLAFENATRRNRPDLQIGDLVYCRVVLTDRDLDTSLSCVDSTGRASGLGPLKGGNLSRVNCALARALLSHPTCPVLEELGKFLSFEIAVGMNGRVWVNSPSPKVTILVSNAIVKAEFLSRPQVSLLIAKLLDANPDLPRHDK